MIKADEICFVRNVQNDCCSSAHCASKFCSYAAQHYVMGDDPGQVIAVI